MTALNTIFGVLLALGLRNYVYVKPLSGVG